jgi:hypothetical protein
MYLGGCRARSGSDRTTCWPSRTPIGLVNVLDGVVRNLVYTGVVPDALDVRLERVEALELLAVVQATLNAIARSQELTVGAAILTGIKAKLIDALEAG